jgi:hypothetical protein
MTIKQGLHRIGEMIVLYFTEDFPFRKRKKYKVSLLAHNIDWFTNCSWTEQLIAFKQIDRYTA